MKPTYRIVSLSLAAGWVGEVREDGKTAYTTPVYEERADAHAAAQRWVRAQKSEKVRESSR